MSPHAESGLERDADSLRQLGKSRAQEETEIYKSQDLKPTALQIIPSYHPGRPGPTSFLTPELPTLNEVRKGESPPDLPVLDLPMCCLGDLANKV